MSQSRGIASGFIGVVAGAGVAAASYFVPSVGSPSDGLFSGFSLSNLGAEQLAELPAGSIGDDFALSVSWIVLVAAALMLAFGFSKEYGKRSRIDHILGMVCGFAGLGVMLMIGAALSDGGALKGGLGVGAIGFLGGLYSFVNGDWTVGVVAPGTSSEAAIRSGRPESGPDDVRDTAIGAGGLILVVLAIWAISWIVGRT